MANDTENDPNKNTGTVETPKPVVIDDPHDEHVQKPHDTDQAKKQDKTGYMKRRFALWCRSVRCNPIPLLTLGLIFCAAAQAIIYFCTMKEIGRQADAADSLSILTKRSIAVAERSIDLSEKTADRSYALSRQIAETQERSSRIQTRAYIGFSAISKYTFKIGQTMVVVAEWKNAGQTPANRIITRSGIKIGTGVYLHEIDSLERGAWTKPKDVNTLGPGMTMTTGTYGREFGPTDSLFVFGRQRKLFAYGIMTYFDSHKHCDTTRFCFEFDPIGQQFFASTFYNETK
jgi:hypothetical protein